MNRLCFKLQQFQGRRAAHQEKHQDSFHAVLICKLAGALGNGGKTRGGILPGSITQQTLWKREGGASIVQAMKMTKAFAITASALMFAGFSALGQSYSEYKFIFSGTAYQTNAAGKLVGTPITDQTLLQDRARLGGIADLSAISIVYHINGNPMGDTVDVVSNATGQVLTTELGLFYGSDAGLGRTAVTNAAQTQVRRVDYIYTFSSSTYTFNNSDSVGCCMTSKSLVTTNGSTNAVIQGALSWGVEPQRTNGPILCIGNFSLGQGVF